MSKLKHQVHHLRLGIPEGGNRSGRHPVDADNLTDTDFLTRVNDITQDNIALQAHRTLKNDNTPIAVWDGISEEINNTIFRKGRVIRRDLLLLDQAPAWYSTSDG